MGHTIFKRCPSCGRNHEIYLKLPLELADGGIDESADIFLNDPFELAECYSWDGLERLAEEAVTFRWFCGRRQASYGLTWRPLLGWDTKLDLARWLCGTVVLGSTGLSVGLLMGSVP